MRCKAYGLCVNFIGEGCLCMFEILNVLIDSIVGKIMVMAGYVGGNAAFPKPLSRAEEEKYMEMYKNGDMSAKNILIEHNLRLVAHIAKKYAQDNDIEDLISIGTIGLIKGINTFDPIKNTRLAAYAARCIEKTILSQRLSWVI